MSAINVFQQNPGAEAKAQSPLHHADLASLVGKGRKNAGIKLVPGVAVKGHRPSQHAEFPHTRQSP